ncbi:hypothetical protein [Nakamurella aerolata]|uniref:Uncharacterized protein n=1 Tax=Nakamurella aerolata TaxID=1656892 RepID=A0A849AAU9_9ACTN|nr:hypothetical protein [Nakamurella aerolata]NNG37655.1 hypothetical protein [Nakamurella aerolata]
MFVPTASNTDFGRYPVNGSAGAGDLYRTDCAEALTIDTNQLTTWTPVGYTWQAYPTQPAAPGAPPAPPAPAPPPPPPSPEELAQRLYKRVDVLIPNHTVGIGPTKPDETIVKVPQWLWVDDPGPQSASISLLGVTVDMTASIESVDWNMGEPTGNPDQGATEPATVHCTGPGAPAPPIAELPFEAKTWKPECGYTYRWRSIPERTNGRGTWPIQANVHWNAHWQSNTGAGGDIPIERTGSSAVKTWELRVRLVNDPNAPQPPPTR